MQKQLTRSSLSPAMRQLLEWMREVYFGRIESIRVAEGEPVLDPPPRIIHEIKFGGENFPRSDVLWRDFLLKSQVAELFSYLHELQDGVIDRIEIKHGLPFRILVARAVSRR